MVTTPTQTGKTYPEPSAQEAMFFFNIIKNMNNTPDINWDEVAQDSGFKNATVARVSHGVFV